MKYKLIIAFLIISLPISGRSEQKKIVELPFSGSAEIPNLLSCRLTKTLVPDCERGSAGCGGKKVDSKTTGGTPSVDTWTFAALNAKKPIVKGSIYQGELQVLNKEGRRITLGFFKFASPLIFDLYFPRNHKPFLWFHMLQADYGQDQNLGFGLTTWGECE